MQYWKYIYFVCKYTILAEHTTHSSRITFSNWATEEHTGLINKGMFLYLPGALLLSLLIYDLESEDWINLYILYGKGSLNACKVLNEIKCTNDGMTWNTQNIWPCLMWITS